MSSAAQRCRDVVIGAMVQLSGVPGPFAVDVGEWEQIERGVAATIDAPNGDVYRVAVELVQRRELAA